MRWFAQVHKTFSGRYYAIIMANGFVTKGDPHYIIAAMRDDFATTAEAKTDGDKWISENQ